MIYVKLDDGRTQNLIHIGLIKLENNSIVYQSAKGSLNEYTETFETEQEAINTTMESVQKIIQENIEKTFKMFA